MCAISVENVVLTGQNAVLGVSLLLALHSRLA